MTVALTDRDLDVLRAVASRLKPGFPTPRLRDIASDLDLASESTVSKHVDRLVAVGLLIRGGRDRYASKRLAVTPAGHEALEPCAACGRAGPR